MKRKITILTIAFLSSVLMCANAFAAATGRCGDSITWTLDDSGNLTLSGSGEMWNNGYDDSPFKDYGIKTVTIGDGITSIGDYAFMGCTGMTELTLPNSVTSIGRGTFVDCSGLTELTLPSSVTSIEEKAFSDCSGLAKITSLAGIPPVCYSEVFDGVNKTNCELIIPGESVAAYKQAEGWKEFSNIRLLAAISGRCGDSITWTLDESCNLTLSGSGEMWNYNRKDLPFKDYGIKTVTIGDGITSIGDYAFVYCSGMTELTLPSSVTSIGNVAFSKCSGLTELTLPSSVKSIGQSAFFNCSGLTELTLPSSVKSIGQSAFFNCSGLSKITSLAGIPPMCGRGVFDGVNKTNCELIVPKGSVAAYKQAYGWNGFSNISGGAAPGRCGDSITWALDDSGNLTLSGSGEMWDYNENDLPFRSLRIKTVTIGDGITRIGDSAFQGCSGLTELTLPNSITSIGNSAFQGCSGLTELTLPNSITSIGNSAFQGCSGLTELTLPNSITSIWEGAFFGCSGLTELTLPNSVKNIGESAFEGCSGVTELTLPSSVTSIGESAFQGCSGLTKLTLPNSVTSIGESAFRGCRGLTELTLPNSITSIGDYAFYSCRGLTELTLSNSLTSIGKYAFKGCIGLEKITSLAEIPPMCGRKVFDGVNKTNCELIVPEESVAAYTQAEVWNEFSNIRGFSGVDVTEADGNTIIAIGNQIEIIGYFTSVEVYGINGALIYKGKDNVVTVPSAGIYLVHVAGKTRKIVVE